MTDVHSKEAQRHEIFMLWNMDKKVKGIHESFQKAHAEKQSTSPLFIAGWKISSEVELM